MITQRIERDVKNSGIMQQYSGTLGVKSNFRDYPGKSGRVGRSASCFSPKSSNSADKRAWQSNSAVDGESIITLIMIHYYRF